MQDITAWKDKLEQTIADTDVEIAQLTSHKERCETALTNMNTPADVAADNIATRSIRVAIDLVDDEVQQELLKVCKYSASSWSLEYVAARKHALL